MFNVLRKRRRKYRSYKKFMKDKKYHKKIKKVLDDLFKILNEINEENQDFAIRTHLLIVAKLLKPFVEKGEITITNIKPKINKDDLRYIG